MIKRMIEAVLGRVSSRFAHDVSKLMVQRMYAQELHPGILVRRRMQEEAADYVEEKMPRALFFAEREDLVKFAVAKASVRGLFMEFGVASGKSIRWIAQWSEATIHGFDSFEGLPEDWSGSSFGKSGFSRGGKLPSVPANVRLHQGWFDKSVPAFLATTPEDCAFLHVDCDLYSSTKTIFDLVGPRLRKGSVIVFDEYFNYPTWREHEYKAFQEFVSQRGIKYEYLGYARHQVVVMLTEVP